MSDVMTEQEALDYIAGISPEIQERFADFVCDVVEDLDTDPASVLVALTPEIITLVKFASLDIETYANIIQQVAAKMDTEGILPEVPNSVGSTDIN